MLGAGAAARQGFGVGLPQDTVNEIVQNSDEFWEGVKSLDESDVQDLDDDDGTVHDSTHLREPAPRRLVWRAQIQFSP